MSNLWINVDDLYNQLSNDDQFETYVLMIPEFDYSKKEFDIQTMNTKIYDFHKNHNHQNTIKAFDQGKWFDLKNINPDYVFYERPYSSYLPIEYKISTVSKYAKTCYLPYGYEMMNYIFDTSLNVDFFRYLHIFFADSYVTESFNKKRAPLSHRLGLRKTILTGHPIFNAFNKAQSEDNLFWDNDDQHFKIIWAPRWTIDTQLGGSNFLTYKDNIVDYVEKDKKRSLVFRPHPLTFKNFISLGLITSDEVDEYLRKFQNNEQLYYDQTSEYFTTFWHSDVFVGDISSIIPCYFLTGKPIIYCHTDAVDDNDIMKKIFSVSYNAYSFEDVEKILLDLQNGIDPLKEKRLKLKNISEYEFEVIKTKAKLENDNEVEIYFKPIKNSRIKESIFCYWCLIYEEEISDKKIHPEGDIFLNKVLISELTKKKYYQSVFLKIENNKGHILETGTEINFIEMLKYLKEESCEGCEELKNYFEKMQDYVLLAGIKINRKNKIL